MQLKQDEIARKCLYSWRRAPCGQNCCV